METREDWQEVILDALINVPFSAVFAKWSAHSANWNGKSSRGWKQLIRHRLKKMCRRTRSQFIMATIWKKQSALKTIISYIMIMINGRKSKFGPMLIIGVMLKTSCYRFDYKMALCPRQYQRLRAEEK